MSNTHNFQILAPECHSDAAAPERLVPGILKSRSVQIPEDSPDVHDCIHLFTLDGIDVSECVGPVIPTTMLHVDGPEAIDDYSCASIEIKHAEQNGFNVNFTSASRAEAIALLERCLKVIQAMPESGIPYMEATA